jgi:hypothetical protein
VVEGPIDSMFIDNCVAVGSSALMSFEHDNSVLIYDNEPRNAEITKLIGTAIDKGRTVVIWPKDFEFKDINDSIVAGYTINQLEDIIVSNTCSGMMAKTRFSAWKK